MKNKKLLTIGIVLLALGFIIPAAATAWFYFSALNTMRTAETAGVGAVDGSVAGAMIFNVVGLVGIVAGAAMIVAAFVWKRGSGDEE